MSHTGADSPRPHDQTEPQPEDEPVLELTDAPKMVTAFLEYDDAGALELRVPLLELERPDRVLLARPGAEPAEYAPKTDAFAFGVPSEQIASTQPLERQDGRAEIADPSMDYRQLGRVGSILRVEVTLSPDDGHPVVQIDTDPEAEVDPPAIRVYVNDGTVYDDGKDLG